jgi:hypothetical protein
MCPTTDLDPKSLIAYLRGLKWPSMEPPDKDKFLSDIMDSLDLEDDLIMGTLYYLIKKKLPPESQIEGIRDLHRTRFGSYKEKLKNHHTDSLKNKAHINELIAFIDELSTVAARTDIWTNNNLQKLAMPRTKWWQFWRG